MGDGLLLDVCSDLSPSSVLRTASHPLIPRSSVATQIHSRFCSSSCFYGSSRFYSRASASTLPVVDPGFSCSALQIRVASWPSRQGPAIQDDRRSSPLSWFSLLFPVILRCCSGGSAPPGRLPQHVIPAVVCRVSEAFLLYQRDFFPS